LVHTEDTRAVAKRLVAGLRARPDCRGLSVERVEIDPLAPDVDLKAALDGVASRLGLDDAVDVSGGTKLMAARVADWARERGLPDDLLTTVSEPGRIHRPFFGTEQRVDTTTTVQELARLHCDRQIVAFGLPSALADDERRRAAAIYFTGRISALMSAPGGTTGSDGTRDHVPSVTEVGHDEQYWNKALSSPAQQSHRAGNRWFELAVLLALVEDGGYDDVRAGVVVGPDDAPRFEVDVAATKTGRLWAFLTTTSEVGDRTGLTKAGWYKVTEAVVRARQLGGDDAQGVVMAVQPDATLKWARHEVEQIFRGQHPPILVGGDRVVGALKRVAALLPEPRPRSSPIGRPTPPPLGEPIDLVIAVGDNPMPVAEAIEAHNAHSALLLVSDRTWRIGKKLTSRLSDGRHLYVQRVRDPYNASSVQRELAASGVRARAVDLTGGTKPMILGLWRWASERSTAVDVTYVPAGSPEMVGVGSSPSRPLPTLPFDGVVQPLSNLSPFELTPDPASVAVGPARRARATASATVDQGRHRSGPAPTGQPARRLLRRHDRAARPTPQLVMIAVGPARSDGTVHQADPAVDHLDSLLDGRHVLLQHRFGQGHQRGHDPRHGRLRDTAQITQKFLRSVLSKMHAHDLHSSVQPTRLQSTDLLVPRLARRLVDASQKLLHLGQPQTCSTMVSQRFFLDHIDGRCANLINIIWRGPFAAADPLSGSRIDQASFE